MTNINKPKTFFHKYYLQQFATGIEHLGILGIICVFAEDVALIFAFSDALTNAVSNFLTIQDISIIPVLLNGITIYSSVKYKLPKKYITKVTSTSWFKWCFWCSCCFISFIALSILISKVSWMAYIIKYSIERIILLIFELTYIIVIEVSKGHLSRFLIRHLS